MGKLDRKKRAAEEADEEEIIDDEDEDLEEEQEERPKQKKKFPKHPEETEEDDDEEVPRPQRKRQPRPDDLEAALDKWIIYSEENGYLQNAEMVQGLIDRLELVGNKKIRQTNMLSDLAELKPQILAILKP